MTKFKIDDRNKKVVVKKIMVIYGDGIHDDTEAIQAYSCGKAILINQNGTLFTDGGIIERPKEVI